MHDAGSIPARGYRPNHSYDVKLFYEYIRNAIYDSVTYTKELLSMHQKKPVNTEEAVNKVRKNTAEVFFEVKATMFSRMVML